VALESGLDVRAHGVESGRKRSGIFAAAFREIGTATALPIDGLCDLRNEFAGLQFAC
jgi:hypothetical protein